MLRLHLFLVGGFIHGLIVDWFFGRGLMIPVRIRYDEGYKDLSKMSDFFVRLDDQLKQ